MLKIKWFCFAIITFCLGVQSESCSSEIKLVLSLTFTNIGAVSACQQWLANGWGRCGAWRRRIFTQTGSSKCSKCYSTDAHIGRLKVSTLHCCLSCFVFATVMQYMGTKQVFKCLKTLFWNDKNLIVLQSLSPGLLVQSASANLSLKVFPFWMNLTIESNQWI